MEGRSRFARNAVVVLTLALGTAGCASPPMRQLASADTHPSPARSRSHQSFLINAVAVVTAMGGNNPNTAYRTLSQNCGRRGPLFSAPQPLDTRSVPPALRQATVSAACARVAAN